MKINQNCMHYIPFLPSPITFKSEREENYSRELFQFEKPQTLADRVAEDILWNTKRHLFSQSLEKGLLKTTPGTEQERCLQQFDYAASISWVLKVKEKAIFAHSTG